MSEIAQPAPGMGQSKGARKRRELRRQKEAAKARAERRERKKWPPEPPICPYCGKPSQYLSSSEELYQGRNFGPVWACRPCGAWVGCHDGTALPLGRLADKMLRILKSRAHAAFDPLWKAKLAKEGGKPAAARGAGYKWLARQLGIRYEACHIGMFDTALCLRTIELCAPYSVRLGRHGIRTPTPPTEGTR